MRLELPEPSFGDGVVHATALYVDSFGNIALNLTRDDLDRVGVVPGTRVELDLSGERYFAVATRTFADARPGDVILFEDSYRNMSIAISSGNAAAMLHVVVGQAAQHPERLTAHRVDIVRRCARVGRTERRRRSGSPSPTSLSCVCGPVRLARRPPGRGADRLDL